MTSGQSTPTPPTRPGRSEPWRHERMVQRVPAHLGEMSSDALPPWLVIAGIVLLVIVVGIVAFFLLGGPARLGFGGAAATGAPTRTPGAVTPIVTVILASPFPPTPTFGPTPAVIRYRIKPGDSLIEIAARYKVSVQAIKDANNLKEDTIRIGDELIIPLPTPTPPGTKPPTFPAGTPTPLSYQSPPTLATSAGAAGVIRHVVQRGDTLISIAATYGSTVDAIRVANQLDSDFLSVGQVLLVPVGAWSPTPSPAPIANIAATPTAPFAYAAPSLLSPPDGKEFRGSQDVPQLMWASPATLKSNEFYVVHIDYAWNGENKSLVPRQVRQGTSVKLEATDYLGVNPSGTQFSWYVMVVSQGAARTPGTDAPVFAASPPSVTRVFVWY